MKSYWDQVASIEERRMAIEAMKERKKSISKIKLVFGSIKRLASFKFSFPFVRLSDIMAKKVSKIRFKLFKTEEEKMEEMKRIIREKFEQGRLYR